MEGDYDFAIDLLYSKLTFDEIVRAFRQKDWDIFQGSYAKRLRASVDRQCKGLAGVLTPALMDIVRDYFGAAALLSALHTRQLAAC